MFSSGVAIGSPQMAPNPSLSVVLVDETQTILNEVTRTWKAKGPKPTQDQVWSRYCQALTKGLERGQGPSGSGWFDHIACKGTFNSEDIAQRNLVSSADWLMVVKTTAQSDSLTIYRRTQKGTFHKEASLQGGDESRLIDMWDDEQEMSRLALQLLKQLPCIWSLTSEELKKLTSEAEVNARSIGFPEEIILFHLTWDEERELWGADFRWIGALKEELGKIRYELEELSDKRTGQDRVCVASEEGRETLKNQTWTSTVNAKTQRKSAASAWENFHALNFGVDLAVGNKSGVNANAPSAWIHMSIPNVPQINRFHLNVLHRPQIQRKEGLTSYLFSEQRAEIGAEWLTPEAGLGSQWSSKVGIRPYVGYLKLLSQLQYDQSSGEAAPPADFNPPGDLMWGADVTMLLFGERHRFEASCGTRLYGYAPKARGGWTTSHIGCQSQFIHRLNVQWGLLFNLAVWDYTLRNEAGGVAWRDDSSNLNLNSFNYTVTWIGSGVYLQW